MSICSGPPTVLGFFPTPVVYTGVVPAKSLKLFYIFINGKNTDVKTDKEITLIDTVEYTNLLRGEPYTVKGKLIDKATGEVMKDAAGNEITAETTFKPWMTQGKVKVKFIFDGSNMFDMDTVVFETVYDSNGHVIAKHDDINDEDQTVTWEKLEPGYHIS